MKTFFPVALCVLSTLFLVNCRSKDPEPTLNVLENTDVSSAANPTIVPVQSRPTPPSKTKFNWLLDWENLTTMPVTASQKPIPMPWSDQATRMYSEDIRNDYRKQDGWEQVYNVFTNTELQAGNLFILYNKYRGLLRCYYYLDGGIDNIKTHDVMSYTMETSGQYAASSPMLNFADQQVVDVEKNSEFVSTVEPRPIATNAWYVSEYEIAYDPNSYAQSFEKFGLNWSFASTKLNALTVNGTNLPKLSFSVRKPGARVDAWNSGFDGTAQVVLNGTNDANAAYSALGTDASARIGSLFTGDALGDLLDGVLPTPTANTRQAHLMKWNANVSLQIGPTALLFARAVGVSGQDHSGIVGAGPLYNETLGVFYLDKRPVVTYTKSVGVDRPHSYTLDVPSVRYLFNPAVTKDADITDIRQEIVARDPADQQPAAKLYRGQVLEASQPLDVVGVRVSFTVVPKNGGAKVRIVKTFKADVTEL
ncbi:MAG: hypothetical protein MUD08_06440 [Cytophagales bacterium]|jgi:hypothetical protein|nr:hypothetical protein [Cytophagales bacterium]